MLNKLPYNSERLNQGEEKEQTHDCIDYQFVGGTTT
jgi:hypothetical protein